MITIKIIDLLTKRANGEGGIKKFRYHNVIWKLNILDYAYYNDSGVEFEDWVDGDLMNCLNEELEILDELDEEDEFEDIYLLCDNSEQYNFSSRQTGMTKEDRRLLDSNFKELLIVVNQLIKNQKKIIDKLNKE